MNTRIAYILATVGTIALGLASRSVASQLPAAVAGFVTAYVGDVLWAAMVFFGVSSIAPTLALGHRTTIALAYCLATELSQLYHAPWIDDLRATRLGGLVLGFGFLWSDLIAYAVGVLAAVAIVRIASRRTS